jgi:hypothetical protein
VKDDLHGLGFAASNADGTEVILMFKEALDLSTLSETDFTFAGKDIAVTSIRMDAGDLNHPTVHLILSRPINSEDVMLLNITGVKSLTNQSISEAAYPIITLISVQQIKELVDLEGDGVHMDDIIKYMNTLGDLTGDNVFDPYDIQFLLQQI